MGCCKNSPYHQEDRSADQQEAARLLSQQIALFLSGKDTILPCQPKVKRRNIAQKKFFIVALEQY